MVIKTNLIKSTIDDTDEDLLVKDNTEDLKNQFKILTETHSNVVSENKLKVVQKKTLSLLKDNLSKTYGPMGSYTAIIRGNGPQDIVTTYSKDGLKVLKNIYFDSPIELALQAELVDICKYVEHKVGDGTTSAVVLSSLIYDGLHDLMSKNDKIPPRKIVNEFCNIVDVMKKLIQNNAKEITLEDIYNICMISTNGNTVVSEQIKDLYKEFGFNVDIDVSISNDPNTKVKMYDGLTINEGYSDPAYINNPDKGTCDIHNAKVYAFADPVDTPEMISFFEKIIYDNIFYPISQRHDVIPTVIICPMISRDGNALLNRLIEIMYQYDKDKAFSQKPPILILTNIHGTDEDVAYDIARLCGARHIRKYINAETQKHDQETGSAPTLETVHEFAGFCELVSADVEKAKFVNPYDLISNGGETYNSIISFLKSEIKNAVDVNEDTVTIGRLKKRLRCLEANMIEYLVGGISVSDRDSLKDLVEDAVKNCASASEYGVGRAANFEGLMAAYQILETADEGMTKDITSIIFNAYFNASKILYSTALDKDKVRDFVIKSMENECPYNVVELLYNEDSTNAGTDVLCSIRTDAEILDAISKIISMMVTSNRCLLQSPTLNRY